MNKVIVMAVEYLLPKRWRKRPAARPEQNDAMMARLDDTDPLYRALMDAAVEQLEGDLRSVIRPDLTPTQREFYAGRANGMGSYLETVTSWSERAKQVKAAELRKKGG